MGSSAQVASNFLRLQVVLWAVALVAWVFSAPSCLSRMGRTVSYKVDVVALSRTSEGLLIAHPDDESGNIDAIVASPEFVGLLRFKSSRAELGWPFPFAELLRPQARLRQKFSESEPLATSEVIQVLQDLAKTGATPWVTDWKGIKQAYQDGTGARVFWLGPTRWRWQLGPALGGLILWGSPLFAVWAGCKKRNWQDRAKLEAVDTCPSCGYSMAGVPGAMCPECGQVHGGRDTPAATTQGT